MPKNISKLIPGIGRARTERYFSLNRFLTAADTESPAHLKSNERFRVMSFMKYGGTEPEIV